MDASFIKISLRLVLLGIFLGLFFTELTLRVIYPTSPYAEVRIVKNTDPKNISSTRTVSLDSSIDNGDELYYNSPNGMRFRPNRDATIYNHRLGGRTVNIRTNSLGFRGSEISSNGGSKILFLGDSITVQDYLPEEDTWVFNVGKNLNDGGYRSQAINAGIGAVGLANELSILVEQGLSINPDVVVLAWYLNDAQDSNGVYLAEIPEWMRYSRFLELLFKSYYSKNQKTTETKYSIPPAEHERWKKNLEMRLQASSDDQHFETEPFSFNRRILNIFFDWGLAWSDDAWSYTRPLFNELNRLRKIHGFKLLIVAMPIAEQVNADFIYDYPQQELKKIAKDLEVPVLDMLPAYRDARTTGIPLFMDWCHPTLEGSKLVASEVSKFIMDNVIE